MRTSRLATVLLALVVSLAACGGDDDAATTTAADDAGAGTQAPADDTTAAPAATSAPDDDADSVTMGDMPGECRDAFVEYLRAIEPAVEGIDFESATLTDIEDIFVDLEPVLTDMEANMESLDCPDLDADDEATRAEVVAIAQQEAPGAAGFLEYTMSFAQQFGGDGDGGVGAGSGDCETDIAAIQEFVDAGGTMSDLTLAELSEVGGLIVAIQTSCPLERFTEFASDPDVAAFIGGG